MSEETRAVLHRAEEELTSARDHARTIELELLHAIAAELPARAEELARKTAHSQPEVTKALGGDGVKKLRADLRLKADELVAVLHGGVDAIKWPQRKPTYSPVTAREVQTAILHFLYGSPVDSMATIFKAAGFNVHDDNAQRHQGLVLPQWLFSERDLQDQFEAVAQALNAVADAQAAAAQAKSADDKDEVDELWD
ncbi:hypothetical protein [Brachybacterium sillae]|uniref:hypothetical protein n=1 Tax=Brachybacterium sillae TaxID=2810536 RepID=UPI00217E176D|nr:hypothetical protein [Brachybacterium sillae]